MVKMVIKGGKFTKTSNYLKSMHNIIPLSRLKHYGELGVLELSSATPVDTGKTANSWVYDIREGNDSTTITWSNTNKPYGVPVAIVLQYGHVTRNGGYVKGTDYINPATKVVFDQILFDLEREAHRR